MFKVTPSKTEIYLIGFGCIPHHKLLYYNFSTTLFHKLFHCPLFKISGMLRLGPWKFKAEAVLVEWSNKTVVLIPENFRTISADTIFTDIHKIVWCDKA